MLRFGTIKSKLAGYLLEQMQHNNSSEFDIVHTQQELADIFGVTRPALSRALSQIIETRIINSKNKHFRINDKDKLIAIFKNI
ncbi:MAG: Crp/Fnr family transcriptional regulator [Coprobacter sp.]